MFSIKNNCKGLCWGLLNSLVKRDVSSFNFKIKCFFNKYIFCKRCKYLMCYEELNLKYFLE